MASNHRHMILTRLAEVQAEVEDWAESMNQRINALAQAVLLDAPHLPSGPVAHPDGDSPPETRPEGHRRAR